MVKINIKRYIEGSREAEGLTVIIDVFRAFSLECYLGFWGADLIFPVDTVEKVQELKRELHQHYPDRRIITIGERQGVKIEGFDFGNSPSQIMREVRPEIYTLPLKDSIVIHTTSAGTQGIANSVHANEIVTGSLVNAKAVADYIRFKNPEVVTLVAMGNSGIRPAPEDELCAEYIKGLAEGKYISTRTVEPEIENRIADLKYEGGKHFFNPNTQDIFPSEDFYMCLELNKFNFVIVNSAIEIGSRTYSVNRFANLHNE